MTLHQGPRTALKLCSRGGISEQSDDIGSKLLRLIGDEQLFSVANWQSFHAYLCGDNRPAHRHGLVGLDPGAAAYAQGYDIERMRAHVRAHVVDSSRDCHLWICFDLGQ